MIVMPSYTMPSYRVRRHCKYCTPAAAGGESLTHQRAYR